jgi:LPXTG-motif cell wall-anchored protein
MQWSKLAKIAVLLTMLFSIIVPFNGTVIAETTSSKLELRDVVFNEEEQTVELVWSLFKTAEDKEVQEEITILKNGVDFPADYQSVNSVEDENGNTILSFELTDSLVQPGDTYAYKIEALLGEDLVSSEVKEVVIPEQVDASNETSSTVKDEESDATATESDSREEQEVADEEDGTLEESESETVTSDEQTGEQSTDASSEEETSSSTEESSDDQNTEDIVMFEDEGLKAAIQVELGLEGEITQEDILNLQSLYLDGSEYDVTSLKGLEYAENLAYIEAYSLEIDSLSPLKELPNLYALYFNETTVTDVSEFLDFPNLNYIDYLGVNVTAEDLQVMKTLLTNGTYIDFDNNVSINFYNTGASDTTIPMEWSYYGVETITDYELYLDGELVKIFPFESVRNYKFEGLEPEQEYDILLIAKNGEEIVSIESYGVLTQAPPSGSVVKFEDENLEKAVKENLDLDRDVYTSDLENLYSLYVSNSEISSLKGLEQAENLESLYIGSNNIKDLTPLKGLTNLLDLDVSYNPVGDISPVSTLTNLFYLNLSGTQIRDLDSLEKLSNLTDLEISETLINSISVLKNLSSLDYLYAYDMLNIENNEVNLGIIKELEDRGVTVDHNIGEGAFLSVGTNTVSDSKASLYWYLYNEKTADYYTVTVGEQTLKLDQNEFDYEYLLEDLSAATAYEVKIEAFKDDELVGKGTVAFETKEEPSGEKVEFADDELTSFIQEQLLIERDVYESDMKNLTYLDIYNSDISSLKGLEKAANLEGLYISGTSIESLSELEMLENLAYLGIYDVPVKDLSTLGKLTGLIDLTIHGVDAVNHDYLTELPNLEYLSLNDTGVSSLPDLSSLSLNHLELSHNNLTSIEFLENLNSLQSLDISNNEISTIDGLSNLENLNDLRIENNPIETINGEFPTLYTLRMGANNLNAEEITNAFPNVNIIEINGEFEVEGMEGLSAISTLRGLTFANTTMSSIDFLLDIPSLGYVYFEGNNENLSFRTGTPEADVVAALEDKDVHVEIYNSHSLDMEDYSSEEDAITVNWYYDGYEKVDSFHLYLNGELVEEVDGDVYSYTFENLQPDTSYVVGVESRYGGGFLASVETDISTLSEGEDAEEDLEKEGEIVEFNDSNLADAIRNQLGLEDEDIYTSDLENLISLEASNWGITDLSGLEYATNLESLWLSFNTIEDLSPLSNLTSLKELSLWGNKISDLHPLAGLTNLAYLDLEGNNITTIASLDTLVSLETLYLTNNPVTNIGALTSMQNLIDVYLEDIDIDFGKDEEATAVVEQLENRGVMVSYEVSTQVYVSMWDTAVTTDSIDVLWFVDGLSGEEIKSVTFYQNDKEVATQEDYKYQFTYDDLEANTNYDLSVKIIDEDGDEHWAYWSVRTAQPETEEVAVQFNLEGEDEKALADFEFSLEGLEESNEFTYVYGNSDENGYLTEWGTKNKQLDLPVGSYELYVFSKGEYDTYRTTIEVTEESGGKTETITLEKVKDEFVDFTLNIQDEEGKPVENIEYISLYSPNKNNFYNGARGYYSVWEESNENGEFSFEDVVSAGDYWVSVQADGFMTYNGNETVTIDKEASILTVVLEKGATIKGEISVENGPIPADLDYTVYGNKTYEYGQVGNDGAFEISGVHEEDLTVELTAYNYEPVQVEVSQEDFVDGVYDLGEIELVPSLSIEGTIIKTDGSNAKNVNVYLYKEGQQWYEYWGKTDANGFFKIYNVEPGTYTLKTDAYNLPSHEETVEVTDTDISTAITLVDNESGSFTGAENTFAASKENVVPGEQIDYRLNYKNSGATTDLTVTFNLPDHVELIPASLLVNGEPATFDGNQVELDEVGQELGVITFKANVSEDADQNISATAVLTTSSKEETALTSNVNVTYVTLQAPAKTANEKIKVYGSGKSGSKVEIYSDDVLLAETTVTGKWWYADAILPIEKGTASEHTLTAKIIDATNKAVYSKPVKVEYEPSLPTITDASITAGWNQDVKLNPYTGVVTTAIVEYTPIDINVAFSEDVDNAYITFLGENYELTKDGDSYKAYVPGTWSSYGEQLMEVTYEKGEEKVTLPLMEVIVLIDPSGYIFEGSMDNRLEGVTAIVEQRDPETGAWKKWNAEAFGQVNPQVTDEKGKYGWDVPQGDWRVKFTKEGYEPYISRTVVVPPPETELNVPLVRVGNPEVTTITPADATNEVELTSAVGVTFDRLMVANDAKQWLQITNKATGEVIPGAFTAVDPVNGYQETGVDSGNFEQDTTTQLAEKFTFTPDTELSAETMYEIVVKAGWRDYAGKELTAAQTATFTTVEQQETDPEDNGDGNDQTSNPDDSEEPEDNSDKEETPDSNEQNENGEKPSDKEDDKESDKSPSNTESKEVNVDIKDNKITVDKDTIKTIGNAKVVTVKAEAYDGENLEVALSEEVIQELKEKGTSIQIDGKDVSLQLPISIFTAKGDVVVHLDKLPAISDALSPVYDFTITQGDATLSKFKEDVTLTFKVDKEKVVNPGDVAVFYFNPETKTWENIGGTYKDGVVTATTNHFSTYTVFETTQSTLTGDELQPEGAEDSEKELPNTGTDIYKFLALGTLLVLVAAALLFYNVYRRRRV